MINTCSVFGNVECYHRIARMLWQNILAVLKLIKLCIRYYCPMGILLSRETLRYASFLSPNAIISSSLSRAKGQSLYAIFLFCTVGWKALCTVGGSLQETKLPVCSSCWSAGMPGGFVCYMLRPQRNTKNLDSCPRFTKNSTCYVFSQSSNEVG